jgi:diguanylate cyclase (GGDEF)-like protein/PAS domain S-box-containing protein
MCHLPNPELLNGLHEGVYLVDLDCRIHFWNDAAAAISGYSADEVMGKRCADDLLVHVDDCGVQKCGDGCPLRRSMADGNPCEAEVYLLHKSGHRVAVSVRTTPVRDLAGHIVGGLEAFVNCDRLGRRVNELEALAFTDPLTGVASRRCFETQMSRAILDARTTAMPLSLVVVDLNDFKPVNDAFGHPAGDAVLVTVAHTLREAVRRTDLVARWGGDEFVILLPSAPSHIAAQACDRIRALVRQARTLYQGKEIRVTVSAGYASLADADDDTTLFQRADRQLYRDKTATRTADLIQITA